MFLYCDNAIEDAEAYFITPDENGEDIQHQYGCVGCSQFHLKGRVEVVPEPLAGQLARLLALPCSYDCEESDVAARIELETELRVQEVMGEALMKLKDGRYVATCNCD